MPKYALRLDSKEIRHAAGSHPCRGERESVCGLDGNPKISRGELMEIVLNGVNLTATLSGFCFAGGRREKSRKVRGYNDFDVLEAFL